MAACSGCAERDGGIGHGKRRSRTELARVGGDVGLAGGSVADGRRQAGGGRARSRARARLNWVSQGQRRGRCRVNRRAERVIRVRPGRRTAAGGSWWSRSADPGRCGRSSGPGCGPSPVPPPGAVGGEAARGEMVQPDAVLEVAYRVLDLGVAAMVSLKFQGLPVPVGDEAVIAVGGEESQLGTGRGLHPPDDEPYRRGVRLSLEGSVEPVSEIRSNEELEGLRGR